VRISGNIFAKEKRKKRKKEEGRKDTQYMSRSFPREEKRGGWLARRGTKLRGYRILREGGVTGKEGVKDGNEN